MKDDPTDSIRRTAIMWYGVELLPTLRAMSFEQLLALMKQAEIHSLENPLHLDGPEKKYDVPLLCEKPLSAAHVTAIMVFGLWVACRENEGLAAGLMRDWGEVIKPAMVLTQDERGQPRVGFYRAPEVAVGAA